MTITPTNSEPSSSSRGVRRELVMLAGVCSIAKDRGPLRLRGDDAFFICTEKKTVGVADGVGGWSSKGIDAGAYARELMNNSMNLILSKPNGEEIDPSRILHEAYIHTRVPGSSTVCLVTLKDNNSLDVVNVGDSGFVLIRDGACVYKSPLQQYRFNYPFQLRFGCADHDPTKAMKLDIVVDPGDVIVLATDGLFDNLFASEIVEISRQGIERAMNPEELARLLARQAFCKSKDATASTPFALDSRGLFPGGKPDDITVIILYINQV